MQNLEAQLDDQEISLIDIVNFLKNAWKTIVMTGVVGILIAIAYLLLAVPQYEATAQIKLAQLNFNGPGLGAPIEDQNSLLARLQFPSNFTQPVITACEYDNKTDPAQSLAKDLKFSIPKGMVNIIELKTLAPSPEKALACANAVVDQIAKLQRAMIETYVDEAKTQLEIYNEKLESAHRIIAKADQAGSAMSAAYLGARDEIAFYLAAKEKMQILMNSAQQKAVQLAAPIFIPQKPVSPKKSISLLAGLFGGMFLGLVIALGRQQYRAYKVKSQEGAV
jgi:uncharacterized protein involved in exopolysaccharide biosynthesis